MSVSIEIKGIRDLDGKYKDMCNLKTICDKTNSSYPKELLEYFKEGSKKYYEPIEDEERLRSLSKDSLEEIMTTIDIDEIISSKEYVQIINVSDIPKDIQAIKIRFC